MGQPLCDLSCDTRDIKRPPRGGAAAKNARMSRACHVRQSGWEGGGEGGEGEGGEGGRIGFSSEPERGVCVRLGVLVFAQ